MENISALALSVIKQFCISACYIMSFTEKHEIINIRFLFIPFVKLLTASYVSSEKSYFIVSVVVVFVTDLTNLGTCH